MSWLSDAFRYGGTRNARAARSMATAAAGADAAFNQQLDALGAPVSMEAATAEAAPLLAAIDAEAAFNRPTVRENTFAGDAEAGFGLSGRAVTNVNRALGNFDAGIESRRQSAIRGAMADITARNQARAADIMGRATLAEQKKANKPRKFLGIF